MNMLYYAYHKHTHGFLNLNDFLKNILNRISFVKFIILRPKHQN
jgi:hypothetical protein